MISIRITYKRTNNTECDKMEILSFFSFIDFIRFFVLKRYIYCKNPKVCTIVHTILSIKITKDKTLKKCNSFDDNWKYFRFRKIIQDIDKKRLVVNWQAQAQQNQNEKKNWYEREISQDFAVTVSFSFFYQLCLYFLSLNISLLLLHTFCVFAWLVLHSCIISNCFI